jgi:hypothetical protein
MASTKPRTTDEIRLLGRNFARIQHFKDATPVLKFYQQSLKDTRFNRIGIRVYDLAEIVGEHLKKPSKDVTFGDFKTIDYAIFNNLQNIGPGTFAALNGLRQGVADNEKDEKSDKRISEKLAELDALAGPLRVEEISAETIPPILVQEVPFITPSVDDGDAPYKFGHTAGQAQAYLNVLKMLGARLSAEPESSSTIVGLIKIVAGMHESVVGR